jgi:hypothetical protein
MVIDGDCVIAGRRWGGEIGRVLLAPNKYPPVPAMRAVITREIIVWRQLDKLTAVERFA